MRIVHRIIQCLAIAPALAGIGIASPAVSRAQAGSGTTISISPSPATAGQQVMIKVQSARACKGGRLSFGDKTKDIGLDQLGGAGYEEIPHMFALGSYVIHTYFDVGSIMSVKEPERTKLNGIYTANCKGGPVTLQVTAPGTKPPPSSAPPAPGSPPNPSGATTSVTCADGTVANAVPGACLNHGGARCADGSVGSGPGACKNHGGLLAGVSANPPPAPPPAPNTNTAGTAVTCNDGTVINNQGAHVCDNHGGFKPAPPAPPNTTAGGVMCNDGTRSNSQGKGACKDHHGILRPIPQPCNDGTMSNNTADLACAHHGGFKNANGTPNTPPAPPPAPNTNTTGATCNDGTTSNATGKGACAHHGGIKRTDSTPNAPPAPPSP